jgi:hypothetical protein
MTIQRCLDRQGPQPLLDNLSAKEFNVFFRQIAHIFSVLEQFSHKAERLLNTSP